MRHVTSDIWHQTSAVRHLISNIIHITHQMSGIWHVTSDFWQLRSDVWHQTCDITRLRSDFWHQNFTLDAWYWTSDNRCLISGRFRQFHFLQKTRITKMKTSKNQDLYLYSILKTEKSKPFFNFQSPLWKPEKSAPFSHEKSEIFRICLRCRVKQLSWVIFISHESQKSWKETFLEFFRLFAFFFKVKKSRLFSSFFVWSFWADSCQIKAGIPIFSPLNW